MRKPSPRTRPWQATLIIALVAVAVAGAAGVGWWYARESPPHQGPIVLISVDAIPAADLPAYGAQRTDTPAIDALASDAVVFERAYSHSPQTLPAHASILSGQLPLAHGVRDDAGFGLPADVPTLPELLRNRGFTTGAAVSTYLLRREAGVAQGFSFFDGELPQQPGETPAVERQGGETVDAAERWLETQDGQRFFLFLQVNEPHADLAVTRLTQALKQRGLYDDATILLVGDRGDVGTGTSLDERALRVPLLVKQPDREGAGRRVPFPVQHVDLLPTILDLVRAPLPDDLDGRSLRAVLADEDASLPDQPIYAEALAAHYRFGGDPVFGVAQGRYRYVRGTGEELIAIAPPEGDAIATGEAGEAGRLRAVLDGLIDGTTLDPPTPPAGHEEERLALLGHLVNLRLAQQTKSGLDTATQAALVEAHRDAAILIGQKRYSAGIRALQALAREHTRLAPLHYQIGTLLVRTGRLEEAIASFRTAQDLRPDSTDVTLALADALMRTGQTAAAGEQADAAIALAEASGPRDLSVAHEMAARVALAHAEAAQDADRRRPVTHFVRGRLLYDEARYEEAAEAFAAAVEGARESGEQMADLHLYYGESLAELDRYAEAETQFREELRAFPRNVHAYASLAMLYRASNRDALVEDVLNELVAATPTPEGYAVAAQLWTILGDRSRAEALRSDARARFRDDPSLVLLGRDGRR